MTPRGTFLAAFLAATAALPLAAAERVYALVSAVGNRFEVVHEVPSVGTHLAPYRRQAYELGDNMGNRLVLQGLDRAVAEIEPTSRRIYLSTHPGRRSRSGEYDIAPVVAELRKLDRSAWDRVLVAMPAHRKLSADGMAARIEGVGLFAQPLCQSDTGFGNRKGSCDTGFRPPSGPEALTPEGGTIAANTFVAPFTFIEVWALDPRTLEVLDRGTRYGHRKLADFKASLDGIVQGNHSEFLARQIVEVVQGAVREAVTETTVRGSVEVKDKGAVAPR